MLALDWSSNMIAVSNAVAFLNTLGVATPFGLVCLVSVFMRSGLTVRSWSRLSGGFCLCSSVGVRTVLVRSPCYTWAGLISFALFCFAQVWSVRFGLHWFGRGCSAPGRLVLVELGLVLFALVCSGVAHSALL